MVYKKYIKKGDKLYGPYYYHSRREGGKVISEYHGPKKKINYKKLNLNPEKIKKAVIIFFGICFLIFMIYFLINLAKGSESISGLTIMNLNANYLKDNQTILIQDQQGKNIISLQLLDPLALIGLGNIEIVEVNVKSYLSSNLNFILDDITYYNKDDEMSKIFRNVHIKEKINGSWKNISQFELLAGEEKNLSIDFSKLNLTLPAGEINISLKYNNQKITLLITNLTEGKIFINKITLNETLKEIPNILTEEEKDILIKKFGNISIEITKAELGKRFVVRYELKDYWLEASYDINLSQEDLEEQMEADKIKWLKDIVKSLTKEEPPAEEIEELLGNYSID